MGLRDARYLPDGIIEFDDTYFGGPGSGGKRGRGTSKTKKVVVALSKDKDGKPKHLKMRAVPDLKGKTIGEFARSEIAENSVIETDALRRYRKPLKEKFDHRWQVYDADS